jgi:hypothetical protein
MSKEKIILSFIAIILGLFVAGGAFYIYQMTRTVDGPTTSKKNNIAQPTKAVLNETNFVIIESPKDEEVFAKRNITISGKTTPETLVIVSTQGSDQIVTSNTKGNFTLTYTLEEGVNILQVTAVFANGEEQKVTRTVTSTTEEF